MGKKELCPLRVTRYASLHWRIVRYEEVDTTQDVARAHGEPGLVVVAEAQNRGRGRRGAYWHSPRGGLWLSAVLPHPPPLHIQVARAVARALRDHYRLLVCADPPNDLSLYGKKLGGVLVEASLQGNRGGPVIVGIGINVNNPLPEELASTAISLREALKREVDLTETLDIVLAALDDLLEERKCLG